MFIAMFNHDIDCFNHWANCSVIFYIEVGITKWIQALRKLQHEGLEYFVHLFGKVVGGGTNFRINIPQGGSVTCLRFFGFP